MRVELLGTVQVRDDAGGPAHVGGPRARALLALLALDAGRVVPAASLIDRLCEGPRGALQSMISRLRGVLGEVIESHPAGYRLAVDRGGRGLSYDEAVSFAGDDGSAGVTAGRGVLVGEEPVHPLLADLTKRRR
jgi:hypothetical protein